MTKPRKKVAAPEFDPAALDALIGERRTIDEVEDLTLPSGERALAGSRIGSRVGRRSAARTGGYGGAG